MNIDEMINAEVDRQLIIWGEQNHADGTGDPNRELARIGRELCSLALRDGTVTWLHILFDKFTAVSAERDEDRLVTELVQCAAVIKSWLAAVDRRRPQLVAA